MALLAIFTYHYLIDPGDPLQKDILGPTRAAFEAQVRHFKNRHRVLMPDEFENFFDGSAGGGREVFVAFTFDDATVEHATYAARFLAQEKIRSLFFVPTGIFSELPPLPSILHHSIARYRLKAVVRWINEGLEAAGSAKRFQGTRPDAMGCISELKRFLRYELDHELNCHVLYGIYERGLQRDIPNATEALFISEKQIPAMREAGHVFGAHTRTHPSLGELLTPELLERELIGPIAELSRVSGTEIRHFAFPFGSKDDYNEKYDALLVGSGIRFAHTTESVLNTPRCDRFRIARKSVYSNDTTESLTRFVTEELAKNAS